MPLLTCIHPSGYVPPSSEENNGEEDDGEEEEEEERTPVEGKFDEARMKKLEEMFPSWASRIPLVCPSNKDDGVCFKKQRAEVLKVRVHIRCMFVLKVYI